MTALDQTLKAVEMHMLVVAACTFLRIYVVAHLCGIYVKRAFNHTCTYRDHTHRSSCKLHAKVLKTQPEQNCSHDCICKAQACHRGSCDS